MEEEVERRLEVGEVHRKEEREGLRKEGEGRKGKFGLMVSGGVIRDLDHLE